MGDSAHRSLKTILLWHFPGLESPGKGHVLVLGSSGNLLNLAKKYEACGRQ